MIDLYTWATPNGRKVSIMLEEVGLAYTPHPVDIAGRPAVQRGYDIPERVQDIPMPRPCRQAARRASLEGVSAET